MTQISTGGYVRHRDRMVQESVYEDLRDTLIACRWLSGTTTRRVVSPYAIGAGYQIVTTDADDLLKLADGSEVKIIDYFPEAGGNDDATGASRKTDPNTLAMDTGVAGDPEFIELGSNLQEMPYTFTFAFYAVSDGAALALMNDLRDRYLGRIVTDDHLNLYNFNDPDFDIDTAPVCRMEIDAFAYTQDAEAVTPWEVHLYYGSLNILDIVDAQSVVTTPEPVAVTGSANFNL